MPVGSEWWGALHDALQANHKARERRQCLSAVSGGVPSGSVVKQVSHDLRRQCLSAVSGGVPEAVDAKAFTRKGRSPMPVGSEWWGAIEYNDVQCSLMDAGSPMPVGSEWWGARWILSSREDCMSLIVANACRQ